MLFNKFIINYNNYYIIINNEKKIKNYKKKQLK